MDKPCIKRKHVFLGLLLVYPIWYTLYSWYYWATHLYLVETVRSEYLSSGWAYNRPSSFDYFDHPFTYSSGGEGVVFFISTHLVVIYLISRIYASLYDSKFMNKCVVKRK